MAGPVSPQLPPLPAQLPALREDLQLHEAAPGRDGSPAWSIQDPVTNQFFRIGWLEFELLSRWGMGSPEQILDSAWEETPLEPDEDELAALYAFLLRNQLLVVHQDLRYIRTMYEEQRKQKPDTLQWLLHHYLFFRMPLVHPTELLARWLPAVEWVYTRSFAILILLLTLTGILLTARQWDSFHASFLDTLSPGGLVGYMLALAVTKSLHELGHAFTATRYGLRVGHMGFAFLVMWPVLYTDTGESWRLHNNRQRLAIASAGILTELMLAGVATLAWNLCDEGDIKQALFFLASTAWMISLALNLSPFMRFDGYFILSDLLDMPNLHERATAMAQVAMRNLLLGWRDPYPEQMRPWPRRLMILFAYGVWIYRLLLFIGIAVAVYYYFFKLLGIFLFLVEILWFVVRPFMNEMKVWHERRAEILSSRKRLAGLALLLTLLLMLLPWNTRVTVEGWAHPQQHIVFSPLPARLLTAPEHKWVQAGDTLFMLERPELDYRAGLAAQASATLEERMRGLASLPEGEEKRAMLLEQQRMHEAEQSAEHAEAERLNLIAPFAGLLTDLDPLLAAGVWVNPKQPLGVLLDPLLWEAELFVPAADVERLSVGSRVRFYPDAQGQTPLDGVVTLVDSTRVLRLPHNLLSAQHGGRIPVLPDKEGLQPRDALYRVRVSLANHPDRPLVLLGRAHIEGHARSWLLEVLKPSLLVLVREMSF